MTASGEAAPSGGRIAAFDIPSGPGVRVDAFGYSGYRTAAAFDSLIAKLIVHSPSGDFAAAAAKAARALGEFRIAGVETNVAFLQALLTHPDFVAGRIDTRFIERRLPELLKSAAEDHRRLYFEAPPKKTRRAAGRSRTRGRKARSRSARRFPARSSPSTSRKATSCGRASRSPSSKR